MRFCGGVADFLASSCAENAGMVELVTHICLHFCSCSQGLFLFPLPRLNYIQAQPFREELSGVYIELRSDSL